MKPLACQNFNRKSWSRFWKPEQIWSETFWNKTWANFEANTILEITTAKRLDLNKPENLLKPETWFWRFKRQLERNLILENTQRFCPQGHTNGLRYLRVGGRGFCLREGKCRGQKNAPKSRRFPHVRYTLCWKALRKARWLKTKPTPSTPKTRPPTDKIIARTLFFRKNQNPHAKLLQE